ncbi:hypothetical protein MHYP_G00216640 [Metynnis hypsauchen]
MKKDGQGNYLSLPNSISLGPHNGKITYNGQVSRCFICQEQDHQAKDCNKIKCWQCGSFGHKGKQCTNIANCTLCGTEGHNFFMCPKSYANISRILPRPNTTDDNNELPKQDNITNQIRIIHKRNKPELTLMSQDAAEAIKEDGDLQDDDVEKEHDSHNIEQQSSSEVNSYSSSSSGESDQEIQETNSSSDGDSSREYESDATETRGTQGSSTQPSALRAVPAQDNMKTVSSNKKKRKNIPPWKEETRLNTFDDVENTKKLWDIGVSYFSIGDNRADGVGPKLLIMGDSYICRGLERAKETMGTNLGLNAHLNWFGRGGMQWRAPIPFFKEHLRGRAVPDVLLIHCGGNDLGRLWSLELVSAMKQDLHDLHLRGVLLRTVLSAITQ